MSGSYRSRERRPARSEALKEPLPLILIVCEGEVTEPSYFNDIANSCRNQRVKITFTQERGTPKTLVEIAKRLKKQAEEEASNQDDENIKYNSVWCVFDIDSHPNINDAKQMARDNRILTAISNPNFELWLLLHFQECPGMQSRVRIREMLKSHIPYYDKRARFVDLSPGLIKAMKRARMLDMIATREFEPGRNPSTGVYLLVDVITGITEGVNYCDD